MINKVTFIGNLGKDPEVKRLESGATVAKLTLATSENFRDKTGEWQSKTEWHDIVIWRDMAEKAEKSLKKGDMIYLEGKLTHRKYEKDGVTKYFSEVVCNYFRNLTKKESSHETATSSIGQPTAAPAPEAESDLPF